MADVGPGRGQEGIRSMLSVRLLSRGRSFGALTWYREKVESFAEPARTSSWRNCSRSTPPARRGPPAWSPDWRRR